MTGVESSHRFARILGEELRRRGVERLPWGSLAWYLEGDAAWRAAVERHAEEEAA